MASWKVTYQFLRKHIRKLEKRLIASHLPADPHVGPAKYDPDVRAYLLLSHAAIEDFVEQVALAVAKEAELRWLNNKRLSRPIVALLICYNADPVLPDHKDSSIDTSFDIIRNALSSARERFSNDVFNNHGISLGYIRKLLYPIGIDISADPRLQASLATLSKERGAFAHTICIANHMAPEDAKLCVDDCLELCRDIWEKAQSVI